MSRGNWDIDKKILVFGGKRAYKHWEIRIAEMLSKNYEIFYTTRHNPEKPPWKPDVILQLMDHELEHLIKFGDEYKVPYIVFFTGTVTSYRNSVKSVIDKVIPVTWTYSAKKQLEEYYEAEFKVNYLGIDLEQPMVKPSDDRSGFYYIGGDWRHKRVEILVRNVPHDELTLIGNHGLKEKFGNIVEVTGYVSDIEKNRIRSRKKCFVHASIREGFNLPAASAIRFSQYLLMYDLPLYHELYPDLIGKYIYLWRSEEELRELVDKIRELPNIKYDGEKYLVKKKLTLQDHVKRLEEMLEEVV